MDQSIWDLLNHGGGAMWVVVAFSVIALAVGIERAIAQWKFVTRARALGETVTRCLSRGALEEGRSACERSPSPIADVFLVGYERLGRAKPEHVLTAVHRERLRVNQDLRSRLWMLGTIGATPAVVNAVVDAPARQSCYRQNRSGLQRTEVPGEGTDEVGRSHYACVA